MVESKRMMLKRVIDLAQPRFVEGTGDEGVLLIHGLASYPGVFDNLTSALQREGYSVSAPRLPGHGTDGADYIASSGGDWLRRARDSLYELAGRCKRVHLLGFSLGGVLALILAAKHDVESLVLLAPAVINTNRQIVLTPFLRHFITKLPGEVEFQGQDPDDPDIAYLAREYWRWKWPAPAAELFTLQRKARAAAKQVSSRTMLIVSQADTAVPVKVKELLEKLIGNHLEKSVVLEKSGHTLPTDCEKERVIAEVVSWFQTLRKREAPPV